MATQEETNNINRLNTKVAVIDTNVKNLVANFDDFKTAASKNQEAIITRMDNFAFAPLSDLNELQLEFNTFKDDIEKNYRKKTDGQTMRNIGGAVIVGIAISFGTIVLTFIINGGLKSGQ